uniref:C3H1-type domain-containing protein n=1 Tax=Spongospora subterranea TaxID=70186 RepID=A0A0H5RAM0_9EUKA|eukprot:CRZ10816.1 hypothetical protein [Spongospora subterranea]
MDVGSEQDDSVMAVELTDDIKRRISEQFKTKLPPNYEFDETSFIEFIMLLVINGRTKSQIQREMTPFVGGASAALVDWLWSALTAVRSAPGSPIKKRKLSSVVLAASAPLPQPAAKANRAARGGVAPSRILSAAVKDATRSTKDAPKPVRRAPSLVRRALSPVRRASFPVKQPTANLTTRHRVMRSPEVKKRSRKSLSPIRDPSPVLSLKTGRRRVVPVNGSSCTITIRNTNVMAAAVPIFNQSLEDVANVQNVKPNEPEPNSTVAFTPQTSDKPTKKPIRCAFWPACEKGTACAFTHPSEPCKFWPRCTFGSKCLYLHNQPLPSGTRLKQAPTACKFGSSCTRTDCKFAHDRRTPKAVSNMSSAPASSGSCRYDPRCTKIACPFLHPKRDSSGFFNSAMRDDDDDGFVEDDEHDDITLVLSNSLPRTPPQSSFDPITVNSQDGFHGPVNSA